MKYSLMFVAILGCVDATTDVKDQPAQPVALGGDIAMQEMSATRIAGTYTFNNDTVVFEGRVLAPDLMSTTLKLHGMTFDSTLDTRDGNRMWSQDAFATDTGADTAINEDDVALMFAFVKVIEAQNAEVSRGDGLLFHFGTVINYWAQWIPAMHPKSIKFEDRDRATDSCYWAQDSTGHWPTGTYPGPTGGTYRWGWYDGHDCDTCSGDPMQGQAASNCSSYTAYGNWDTPDTTYYLYGGAWHTTSNGHGGGTATKIEGQCFGRYGAGCGNGTAYFQENGSHDHCVRDGHVIISAWCSDELYNTTQPYNCY